MRVIDGKISPIVVVLLRISDNLGKVREGLDTGLKDLKIGPVLDELFGASPGPKLNCSQQKVRGSFSGSVADPVKVKGVLTGMVNPPGPALTEGALLPVEVVTGQVLPVPDVE